MESTIWTAAEPGAAILVLGRRRHILHQFSSTGSRTARAHCTSGDTFERSLFHALETSSCHTDGLFGVAQLPRGFWRRKVADRNFHFLIIESDGKRPGLSVTATEAPKHLKFSEQ